MYWSTHAGPVPLEELGLVNTTFLATGTPKCDPMLVWGTTVDTDRLEEFVAEQRRTTGLLISPAHVLIRAVAAALVKHPEINRRVIGKRVYRYDGVNIVMPMRRTSAGEVDWVYLRGAHQLSLPQIAERMWNEARTMAQDAAAEREQARQDTPWRAYWRSVARRVYLRSVLVTSRLGFRMANLRRLPTIYRWQELLNGANAFVNYLGAPGTPPLICHKPAVLPLNSYSIYMTMGPSEPRPVVVDNAIVIRKQASLFCRLDHRFVNGFQAGSFMATMRSSLSDPWTLTESPDETDKQQVA